MTSEGHYAGPPADATSGGPTSDGFPPDSDGQRISGRAAAQPPAGGFPTSYGPPPPTTPNGGSPFVVPAVATFGHGAEASAGRRAGTSYGSARVPKADDARGMASPYGPVSPGAGPASRNDPGAVGQPASGTPFAASGGAGSGMSFISASGAADSGTPFSGPGQGGSGTVFGESGQAGVGMAFGGPVAGPGSEAEAAHSIWAPPPGSRPAESDAPFSGHDNGSAGHDNGWAQQTPAAPPDAPLPQRNPSPPAALVEFDGFAAGNPARGAADPATGRPPGISAFGDQRVRVPGATLTDLPDAPQPSAAGHSPESDAVPARPADPGGWPSGGFPLRATGNGAFPTRRGDSGGFPLRSPAGPGAPLMSPAAQDGDPSPWSTAGTDSDADSPPAASGVPSAGDLPLRRQHSPYGSPQSYPPAPFAPVEAPPAAFSAFGARDVEDAPHPYARATPPADAAAPPFGQVPPAFGDASGLAFAATSEGAPSPFQDSSSGSVGSPWRVPGATGSASGSPRLADADLTGSPASAAGFDDGAAGSASGVADAAASSGVPASGLSASGVPGAGLPGSGVPAGEISVNGFAGSEVPGSGMRGTGVPGSGGAPVHGVAGRPIPGPASASARVVAGSASVPGGSADVAGGSVGGAFALDGSLGHGTGSDGDPGGSVIADSRNGAVPLPRDPAGHPAPAVGSARPVTASASVPSGSRVAPVDRSELPPRTVAPQARVYGRPVRVESDEDDGAGADGRRPTRPANDEAAPPFVAVSPFGGRIEEAPRVGVFGPPATPADDRHPESRPTVPADDPSRPDGFRPTAFADPDDRDHHRRGAFGLPAFPDSPAAEPARPGDLSSAAFAKSAARSPDRPSDLGSAAVPDATHRADLAHPAEQTPHGTSDRDPSGGIGSPIAGGVGPAMGGGPVGGERNGRPGVGFTPQPGSGQTEPGGTESPAAPPSGRASVNPPVRPDEPQDRVAGGSIPHGPGTFGTPHGDDGGAAVGFGSPAYPNGPDAAPPARATARATASARVAPRSPLGSGPYPAPEVAGRGGPGFAPEQYSERTTDIAGRGERPYVPAPALPSYPPPAQLGDGLPGRATVTPPSPDETTSWPGVEQEQGRFDKVKADPAPAAKPETSHVRMLPTLLAVVVVAGLIMGLAFGVVYLVAGGSSNSNSLTVKTGDCVKKSGTAAVKATCGDAESYQVVAIVNNESSCEDRNQPYVVNPTTKGRTQVLCLKPNG